MPTLVDPPVTPLSSIEELRAWLEECERQVRLAPDDEGWRVALENARQMLELAEADQR